MNVLKKPTYSISEKELTLATNATTSDMIYSTVSNLGNLNKCNIKWMSSNTSLLEVKNDTTSKPTLITKGYGEVTLKCQFTDLVAKNNKSDVYKRQGQDLIMKKCSCGIFGKNGRGILTF